MTTKTCTKCARCLPLDAYGAQTASPDGRRSACRPCRRGEDYIPHTPRSRPAPKKVAPTQLAATHAWTLPAACRDMDPDLFESAGAPNPEAVAACLRCPIREMCLEEELRLNSGPKEGQFGYRGGTTSQQRVAILRARKAAAKEAAEAHTA